MRVAIIVDNDLDDDVRVNKEIKMLKKLNYEVSVLCFDFKEKNYLEHDFEVTRITISRPLKNALYFFNLVLPFYRLLWIRHIKRFLSSSKFDIVHTHDLYMSVPVRKAIEKSKVQVPLVLDLHENYPVAYASYTWVSENSLKKVFTQPEKWSKLEKRYLKSADGIITLSDDFRDDLCLRYPVLKNTEWFTLPNVQDLEVLGIPEKAKNNSTTDKTVFLYFGVIGVRRGVFDVIDAFIELQKQRSDIKLLLIGPVDKADRTRFTEKLALLEDEFFEYIPWLPQRELLNYTRISDVGLCPLHVNAQHESGVANKVYQYMYAKLPLLVSNCKPQMRIVKVHNIGEVFSNQQELIRSIEKFADSGVDKNNLIGEKAYKVLLENYSLDSYISGLKRFYEKLTDSL